ncbi:MAG: hypothetical protein ACKVVT_17440 [Dehalococcoidia bacterium]
MSSPLSLLNSPAPAASGAGARIALLGVVAVVGLLAFAGIRPTQFWILWLTSGLVALATDGLVRSHPRWEDPRPVGSLAYAMLPALVVLASGHFIEEAIDGYSRAGVAALTGVVAAVVAAIEYQSVDSGALGYGTARLLLAVATYVTAFAAFSVVFTSGLDRALGAAAAGGVAFLLALELLRETRRLGASSLLVALAIGVSIAELRLGLYFCPLDGLLAGALMIIGFYLATGLVHHLLDHDLEWLTAAEYFLVAAAGSGAVIVTRLTT